MSKIPEYVWEAARKAVLDGMDYRPIAQVARAIMAERERCAKIVEDERDRVLSKQDGNDPAIDAQTRMIEVLLLGIAASIRGDQP